MGFDLSALETPHQIRRRNALRNLRGRNSAKRLQLRISSPEIEGHDHPAEVEYYGFNHIYKSSTAGCVPRGEATDGELCTHQLAGATSVTVADAIQIR